MSHPDSDASGFLARWDEWYQDIPPLARMLRDNYPGLSLRIHSLPDAKRFPDSDAEYRELLARQNAVATAVLGPGAHCMLVLLASCNADLRDLSEASGLGQVVHDLRYAGRLQDLFSERYFARPMCFYSTPVQWKAGSFDGFIRSTAEGRSSGLVVELEKGRVYAPYDGGADLLFATEHERNLAAATFAAWT